MIKSALVASYYKFAKSIVWISFICLDMSSLCAAAETSDAHVPLSEAAEWSLTTADTELLQALLKAGLQINEPIDVSIGQDALGWTLLHFAAGRGDERYIQFLLDHGADVSKRDRDGTRPIDIAFEKGMTNICQQLANPKPATTLIDGFPQEILEVFFRFSRTNAVLVCINGKDPSGEILGTDPKIALPAGNYVYTTYQAAVSAAPKCLAAHVAQVTGRR